MKNYEDLEGGIRLYFNDLKKSKPLKKEEERELIVKYKTEGDILARNKLITSNLRYVCKLANSYRGNGLTFSELISEANSGLITAIEKYDINALEQVKLICYAKWWVIRYIQKAIEKRNDTPATPDEENDECTDGECCEPSLQTKYIQQYDTSNERDDDMDNAQVFVNDVMSVLNERERDIIDMYYGRKSYEPVTMEEIGRKYGMTRERTRMIIKKAFKKMRSKAVILNKSHAYY